MPITELALLHTKSHNPPSSTTITHLQQAQSAQTAFSTYQVHLFTQLEDPSYIYLLGGWDSAKQHYEEWIPSTTNQGLLALLRDEVDVVWMFHFERLWEGEIPLSAPVVGVGRYFVNGGVKREGEFERVFGGSKHYLEEYTRPFPVLGGWRVEDDNDDGKEFVLLSGWEEVEQNFRFADSDGFKKIRDYLTGAEIKHMVLLK
ncbi:hypothetical protein ASPWEDRAFT_32492 [Aspergillus wentii DTO 134E9]|uniref:ABM domain-containing protein n=1 Tax=Aspergillus wentii DTO 134E9 TaxID=1073089 RepID=A0A1L9R5W2_ASPWE|nr:uncharacterized protein ASPWEDRAFT_32492 [Aspergillus wentii DTO 134E9]KAI9925209.1 hypothetical protein MW887_006129 [Aspergillus wentii]OJJ30300.1 hypothetical protein ASPWEDRAFT_32492 [Aspergillus wentii DTO 134E9]